MTSPLLAANERRGKVFRGCSCHAGGLVSAVGSVVALAPTQALPWSERFQQGPGDGTHFILKAAVVVIVYLLSDYGILSLIINQ